mmetsp:Transcript_62639/g.136014  ORF Transcript_62639/g.136014 Transcript_62639/m.136014 type:complete len:139 (-) Transcript_62639:24-440(-)|eukprot:CAMPEP_0170626518 /NCGR_PEP_ID=MMETSP0224-20130122/31403_1 /TAXON_ID=285029 /ORGANISM="Togula jolla, Strain CCCM 725" /LENGTH=138 /DNA_ID=CAMNT_0010953301 /DNA_START=64 /DNA_END=480 /DNA_ORIENTATION=+
MAASKGCLICQAPSVKYRFPCCRERYCSLPCYRVHASTGCHGREATQAPDSKRPRKDDAEEEEDLLSEVKLCALRGHAGVRDALQSDKFREVIKSLDGADDRRAALEMLLEKDAFFTKFVDQMMEAVDYFPPGTGPAA